MPSDDPSKVDSHVAVNDMPIKEPQQLKDEEKSRIRTIIEQDEYLNKLLKQGNWRIADLSTWSQDSQRIGGTALILFEKSIWFDNSYYNIFTRDVQKVAIWTGSIKVFVDLREDKVAGLDVGLGRPGEAVPAAVQPEARKVAHERAKKEFGNNIETTLLGTFYSIAEHPKGLAVFLVTQERKDRMIVTVDLDSMSIDEKRITKMVGIK